jgi:CoA-transferase family III
MASMGNRHPSIAPYETLAAQDGYLALCCGNDEQFRRLTIVLGIPNTANDVRFASNGARVTNRDNLVQVLEAALGSTLSTRGPPNSPLWACPLDGSVPSPMPLILPSVLASSPPCPSAQMPHHRLATPSR